MMILHIIFCVGVVLIAGRSDTAAVTDGAAGASAGTGNGLEKDSNFPYEAETAELQVLSAADRQQSGSDPGTPEPDAEGDCSLS